MCLCSRASVTALVTGANRVDRVGKQRPSRCRDAAGHPAGVRGNVDERLHCRRLPAVRGTRTPSRGLGSPGRRVAAAAAARPLLPARPRTAPKHHSRPAAPPPSGNSRRVLLSGSRVVGAGSYRLHRSASTRARFDRQVSWRRRTGSPSCAGFQGQARAGAAWQPTASGSVRARDLSASARTVSASYSRVESLAQGTIRRASSRASSASAADGLG